MHRKEGWSYLSAARVLLPLAILALLGCDGGADSILFQDVRIVDGTGSPSFPGAVRVRGDRIEAVGELGPRRGEAIVRGDGLVLSPGFIDTHSHHDHGLFEGGRSAVAAVSQGITTVVVGQDGESRYPLTDLFAQFEATPPAVNLASYTGHGTLRVMVMGDDFRRAATAAEIDSMASLLRMDMRGGSLGLGTGLEYIHGFFSTTDEVIALARVSAAEGGRYVSHIRSEDRTFWEAIDEVLRIGEEADIPVHVSHMKLAMTSLQGRAGELIGRLDEARARGVEVTADVYPYTRWQTTMTVLVPDGDFTREAVDFALREVATPEEFIVGRFSPEPSYVGRTLQEIAAERGEDPTTTYLALVDMAHGPDAPADADETIVARGMREEDVHEFLRWEHTNVGSDGELSGPHPRGFGSFTRVLRTLVREGGVLTLEDAVHRMTALSAEHVGIGDRGVIREGAYADLVLFDPSTVSDSADLDEPHRVSTGIVGVWVNGTQVWGEGTPESSTHPGRPVRRRAN